MFASTKRPSVNRVDADSPPATALMSRALPAAHPSAHVLLGALGTSRNMPNRLNPSAPKNWMFVGPRAPTMNRPEVTTIGSAHTFDVEIATHRAALLSTFSDDLRNGTVIRASPLSKSRASCCSAAAGSDPIQHECRRDRFGNERITAIYQCRSRVRRRYASLMSHFFSLLI